MKLALLFAAALAVTSTAQAAPSRTGDASAMDRLGWATAIAASCDGYELSYEAQELNQFMTGNRRDDIPYASVQAYAFGIKRAEENLRVFAHTKGWSAQVVCDMFLPGHEFIKHDEE